MTKLLEAEQAGTIPARARPERLPSGETVQIKMRPDLPRGARRWLVLVDGDRVAACFTLEQAEKWRAYWRSMGRVVRRWPAS